MTILLFFVNFLESLSVYIVGKAALVLCACTYCLIRKPKSLFESSYVPLVQHFILVLYFSVSLGQNFTMDCCGTMQASNSSANLITSLFKPVIILNLWINVTITTILLITTSGVKIHFEGGYIILRPLSVQISLPTVSVFQQSYNLFAVVSLGGSNILFWIRYLRHCIHCRPFINAEVPFSSCGNRSYCRQFGADRHQASMWSEVCFLLNAHNRSLRTIVWSLQISPQILFKGTSA